MAVVAKKRKKTVAFFFGGRSAEHEISIISARSLISNLDRSRFRPLAVFVDGGGVWKKADERAFTRSAALPGADSRALLPAPAKGILRMLPPRARGGQTARNVRIDAAFPVIHGTGGEDGAIQGVFENWGVPYVGARVLASALCSDKLVSKRLLRGAGLPVVPFEGLGKTEWEKKGAKSATAAARRAGLPCFVKPSNLGSSIGVSKAKTAKDAAVAAERAFEFAETVIFERAVPDAREIEVGVLGNDDPEASVAGEIVPSGEFYDYEAKYGGGGSRLDVPAVLPARLEKRLRAAAVEAFGVLRCEGMARVDFLVNPRSGEFFVSELNTIPGFTSISMYPMLWEASGVSYTELISRLIDLGIESSARAAGLKTRYEGAVISP